MIYEFPDFGTPIRQGDIFIGLPRVEVTLGEIAVIDSEGTHESRWEDIAFGGQDIKAICQLRPVSAIVISQDCDTLRATDIALCEISNFRDVEGKSKDTSSPKSWMNILTQHARINLKWFYLPPDPQIGFREKMAVDFAVGLRVPRTELEDWRRYRKGRLNSVADEHFRERLSEFFRRYPYDEWYALDPQDFAAYQKTYPEVVPFAWQHADPESLK